jgi:hypothetical protein
MKIPFWRTLADSYRFFFGDLVWFVFASGGWLVALAATALAGMAVARFSPALAFILVMIGAVLFYLGGSFAFAVSWHRLILRHEAPRLTPRFTRREWRFAGCSALIGLVAGATTIAAAGAAAALAVALVAAIGPLGYVFLVVPALCIIVGWWLMGRLSLALPATAIDEPGGQLRAAWRRGRGNGIRLFFGPLFAAVPVILVELVLQVVLGPPMWRSEGHIVAATAFQPEAAKLAISALDLVLSFVQVALMVGFLSFAYRRITEGTELPD